MKKFYLVAPSIKLPLAKSHLFTYSSEQELTVGSHVSISFGFKKITGIIFEKTKRPPYPTKNISLIEEGLLTKNQIALARLVAEYYYCPLGSVLKLFVLKKTKKQTPPPKIKERSVFKKITLSVAQKKALATIKKTKKNEFLLFGPASSGKTEIIMRLAEEIILSGKQVLILVPEIFLGHHEIKRYQERFIDQSKLKLSSQEIAFYHSNLKNSEATYIQEKIKSGKIKLIIATRGGVFLPFQKLGLIAIDEEQATSYKEWDSSPFYHAGKVATFLSQLFSAKLFFISATPSVDKYYQATQKKIFLIKLPALKIDKLKVKPPVIEVLPSRLWLKDNFHFSLDRELQKEITNLIEQRELTAFLVAQRGESRSVICQDCRTKLLCPNCKMPLNHIKNNFKCFHCSFKISSLSAKCSKCGSFRLIDFGFGTQSIADEINTALPQAKIALVDQENLNHSKSRQKILSDIQSGTVDILIGTYAIAKGFDFPKLSLAVVPDAESFYGKSNYFFDEQYLANLFQLAGRVNRPGSKQTGRCLIYTKNSNNLLFQFLTKWNWEKFLKQELENRQALFLPPFGKILKITYKSSKLSPLEKEVKRVYNKLSSEFKKELTVSIPTEKPQKRRTLFQQSILIKISGQKIPNKVNDFLLKLGANWQINVDPLDV
ncbi:MAG TPA: primosomal protein N' [Candidatus Moranbacteria bacterium]|nr:primosomal protein N' [Candidatus Moranbacteria bacterium]